MAVSASTDRVREAAEALDERSGESSGQLAKTGTPDKSQKTKKVQSTPRKIRQHPRPYNQDNQTTLSVPIPPEWQRT